MDYKEILDNNLYGGLFKALLEYIDNNPNNLKLNENSHLCLMSALTKYYSLTPVEYIDISGEKHEFIIISESIYHVKENIFHRYWNNEFKKILLDKRGLEHTNENLNKIIVMYHRTPNEFHNVSDVVDDMLDSHIIKTYRTNTLKFYKQEFDKLDKSIMLQPVRKETYNKYIHIKNPKWYRTGYKEYSFDDNDYSKLTIDSKYIVIRQWSGYFKINFEFGVCKYLDDEENIALFEVKDESFMLPRDVEFDIYLELKNYRRSQRIIKLLE